LSISGAITAIGARGRLDGEAQARGEAHYAQHANRVFAVTRFRLADDAQRLVADVGDAAVVVQHLLRRRVVVHRIDGEVAPHRVLVLRPEAVVAQDAAVFILRRVHFAGAAEGGHLEQVLAEHHVHDLEALADDEGAPEQPLDLFGRSVGGDVEVFRLDAEQQVAHRAADDEGLETGILQRRGHPDRVRRHQFGIDPVFCRAEHDGFARVARWLFLDAEDLADEFFNH
jgi:ATP-dependent Clp protease adapter protein ClpS